VATEATAVIERAEEMTDAGLEVLEGIAVHDLLETIVEEMVVIDVTRDQITEEVEIVIAETTTDGTHKSAEEAVVAAHVETTRVTSSHAQKMEIPRTTAIRKAARLQVSVKTDSEHD
jgi:hypothetical protein